MEIKHDRKVLVHNTHGDEGSGWLQKWKTYKHISPDQVVYCSNLDDHPTKVEAVHGGHVKEVDGKASKKYIVPLCAKCNENKDDEFQYKVWESVMLPVVEID